MKKISKIKEIKKYLYTFVVYLKKSLIKNNKVFNFKF